MPPPLGCQGAAPGDQRPPPTPPPPLPLRPKSGWRQTEETAAPHYPDEAAAPGVRGHHGRGRRPFALPAAGRRRTGGAQDGANGAAPSEAGPGKTGVQTTVGGYAPFPPPPAPLTRWRPTGPRPTPAAAWQPPRHEYTPGGHAGDNRWRADARRGGRAGVRPPHPPPCFPPPSLGATGATLRPPRAEGTPPLPQKGPRRGRGGMRLDLHTARPSAPSRLLPQGSRPTGEPTPARRSNARTKPGGGARRRTRTVWRPRPP